jgi:hypothetical protein
MRYTDVHLTFDNLRYITEFKIYSFSKVAKVFAENQILLVVINVTL